MSHRKVSMCTEQKALENNAPWPAWLWNGCFTHTQSNRCDFCKFPLTCSLICPMNVTLVYSIWYRFERLKGKSVLFVQLSILPWKAHTKYFIQKTVLWVIYKVDNEFCIVQYFLLADWHLLCLLIHICLLKRNMT